MPSENPINNIEKERDDCKETDPLKENVQEQNEEEKRNCKDTCCHILRNITVEPTMILYVIPTIIIIITSQNLSLQKACRVNLNFTTEICDALKNQTLEEGNIFERDAQRLVAKTLAWRTYFTATLPCILALFIGSWADRTGYRKIFIIISVLGQLFMNLNGIVNTYFFYQLRLEVFVIIEAIFESISGSWCVVSLTTFAYISAITSDENRTFRMGLINFSFTVAFPVGMGLSGTILNNFGYYGCYGTSTGIVLLNLYYNIFILRDPERTIEQKSQNKKGSLHFLCLFFDLTNIKETIHVVFKKGPNNRRQKICVMLLVFCILFGPTHGELIVLYISTRYRFNWNELKFSIFQVYNFITHTIGTIICLLVFSKHLQWHDSILGIISSFSKIASSFIFCFASNESIFFIAPIIDIFNGAALLAMRSIVSKMVSSDEFGKVNSVFGLIENLVPLVYIPLYTKVYVATMEILPGAFFLMGSSMTLPALALFIYLLWEYLKNKNDLKQPYDVELSKTNRVEL